MTPLYCVHCIIYIGLPEPGTYLSTSCAVTVWDGEALCRTHLAKQVQRRADEYLGCAA